MSRFIESIRISNGIVENLPLHQERVNRALQAYAAPSPIRLEDHIQTDELSDQTVYKCRVVYDLHTIKEIQYIPYQKRPVKSLGIVRDDGIAYQHKFTNREPINQLLSASGTDDIIIVKEGCVTDASYANLVFYDGSDWYTSDTPLLRGVQREHLLRNKTIKETLIREKDVSDFISIRLINAMIPWEEAIEIPINVISFTP